MNSVNSARICVSTPSPMLRLLRSAPQILVTCRTEARTQAPTQRIHDGPVVIHLGRDSRSRYPARCRGLWHLPRASFGVRCQRSLALVVIVHLSVKNLGE